MIRKIIEIDQKKCNGCGLCASACHEGAIGMVSGKAVLLRDDYCDGLGDCLPACPTGAISFVEREAAAYDEAAVKARQALRSRNWPVQIKLAPITAPYFDHANLLIAADCTAYAYGNSDESFRKTFLQNRVTLIGCPKLDAVDYSEKLTSIITDNDIQSVTVLRMEVPCCGGMEYSIKKALQASGKTIPLQVIVVGIDGTVITR